MSRFTDLYFGMKANYERDRKVADLYRDPVEPLGEAAAGQEFSGSAHDPGWYSAAGGVDGREVEW